MADNIERLELALENEKQRLLEQNQKKLLTAAERNDLQTIKQLVEKEKSVPLKSTNKDLQTVAFVAAKNGHLDIVKYVADTQPLILSNRDRYGDTVLHLPEEKTVMFIIKYLEEKYNNDIPKWDRQDFERMAIHGAAKSGHWDVLKYFIEKKNCDVNAPNDRHQPPIFTAVQHQRKDIFKYLVEERKANLTALDDNNDNILFVAVTADDLPTMKYVLDERKVNIDVNWQNKFRHTLVHRTAILNRLSILEYLVEQKHADLNVQGHENRTALDLASTRNFYEFCKYLVEHGADTQLKDQFGYYPHQKAFDKKLVEYMKNVSFSKNVSSPRNRRNVDFQPIRLLDDNTIATIRTGNTLGDRGRISIVDSYTSQLPNFLLVAQWILGNAPRQRSLSVTMHNEMDQVALRAVDNLPSLFDE